MPALSAIATFRYTPDMPLYEYKCRGCGNEFEVLVRPPASPTCPGCQSADLERLLSGFAVTSAEQLKRAVRAGKEHLNKTTWRDQREYQKEIEHNHDH